MSSSQSPQPSEPGPAPALERYRQASEGSAPSGDDEQALFEALEGRIAEAERRPTWRLRSQRTGVRRAVALGLFAVIAAVVGLEWRRGDWGVYPPGRMALALGALGVLLGLSLWSALRPLHRPALPRWKGWGLAALALLATLVLAALPAAHTATAVAIPEVPLWQHAPPCIVIGLLFGLPVYALARLLDRGSSLSPVLAAAAAGLAGNFVLQLHCPITAPVHNLAGHFTVAVLFVGGIGLAEALRRRAGGPPAG